MSANTYNAPDLIVEGGRLYIPVSWDRADALRNRLDKIGVVAVVQFDAHTREARVEVPVGTDPALLREVMDGSPL
jgi:hypothetical protein